MAERSAVTMVMIARDEERAIGRALASVAPHVAEMVVLDTGSRDDTVAIARAAGARVEHFTWCDDFAAARNAALGHARTPWRLVLDADEWLVEGGDHLAHLGAAGGSRAGLAQVRSLHPEDGAESVDVGIRLLPAAGHYVGRIHEQVAGIDGTLPTPIVLGHDGYLPEQAGRKRGRNEELLRRELAAGTGHVGYLRFQLGRDLEIQERFVEAVGEYALASETGPSDAPWAHELAVRRVYSLGKAGRYEAASAAFEAAVGRWSHSPDLYFVYADVLLDLATDRPAHAAAVAPVIERCWRQCLALGERPDLVGAVHGRGSILAQRNLDTWLGLQAR